MIFCVRPARLVPFCGITKCFLCLRGPGQAKKMKELVATIGMNQMMYRIITATIHLQYNFLTGLHIDLNLP